MQKGLLWDAVGCRQRLETMNTERPGSPNASNEPYIGAGRWKIRPPHGRAVRPRIGTRLITRFHPRIPATVWTFAARVLICRSPPGALQPVVGEWVTRFMRDAKRSWSQCSVKSTPGKENSCCCAGWSKQATSGPAGRLPQPDEAARHANQGRSVRASRTDSPTGNLKPGWNRSRRAELMKVARPPAYSSGA